jgi:cytochrome c553
MPDDPKAVPIIWGQERTYFTKQMRDYRTGDRVSEVMLPIAKDFGPAESRKIAAYFAAKTWPEMPAPKSAARPPRGIGQCQSCHATSFEGAMSGPRLAGLSYEYLLDSMNAFASGQRTNNEDMPKFMQALTERQRMAMARYIADARPVKKAVAARASSKPGARAAGAPRGGFAIDE